LCEIFFWSNHFFCEIKILNTHSQGSLPLFLHENLMQFMPHGLLVIESIFFIST
jgi:hypothetical protein